MARRERADLPPPFVREGESDGDERERQERGDARRREEPRARQRGANALAELERECAHRRDEHEERRQLHEGRAPRLPRADPGGEEEERERREELVRGAEDRPDDEPGRLRLAVHEDGAGREDEVEERHAEREERGEPAATRPPEPEELLEEVAAETRGDVERVVDERGEGEHSEREPPRDRDPEDRVAEVGDAARVDDAR